MQVLVRRPKQVDRTSEIISKKQNLIILDMEISFKSVLPPYPLENLFHSPERAPGLSNESAVRAHHAGTNLGAPAPQPRSVPLALFSLQSPGAIFFLKIPHPAQALPQPPGSKIRGGTSFLKVQGHTTGILTV